MGGPLERRAGSSHLGGGDRGLFKRRNGDWPRAGNLYLMLASGEP